VADARSMPSRIGKYRIIDRIGRGTMGIVYSAQDEVMGRQVGLKVLMADLESDPETRARFYREAKAAARLFHQNIISIFDAGEDQGRSFIAMELLEGAPLKGYLKHAEAAPLERKLDLMIQICEGLTAAHGEGIVHRDLKPSNLFVQSNGLLKILDFGVARFVDSSMTAVGTMLGTPDYMSPEQARGGAVDARSDIFSAGAVFYFVLTGRKPFPGADMPTVLQQLQFEQPSPFGDGVPRELQDLILRCMSKKAEDRPSRVEEVLAVLVRFRRQYLSETRRLTMTARARHDEVNGLSAAVADAATAIGAPRDESIAAALRSIQDRLPQLGSRGPAPDGAMQERGRVMALVDELTQLRDRLTHELAASRAHAVKLEEGERALATGHAREALRTFEDVLAASPASARARELAESARPLAAEQAARDERIAVRTTAARRALDIRDYPTAVAECRQALALSPGHELASSLLAEAEQAIAREQRRIALIVQRLADKASQAIAEQDFDAAEAALREADAVAPASTVVTALRQRLSAERAAAESAELLRQLSDDEIRRARSVFRRGRYDEAVQQLRGFIEVEPDADEVKEELDQLIALRETIAQATTAARRSAGEFRARAAALAQSGDVAGALGLAREALQVDATDRDAATLVDQLLARQLEDRLAQKRQEALDERAREAEPLVSASRAARDRGYLQLALNAALAAQALAPHRTDIGALVDDTRAELASEDREVFDLSGPAAVTPVPRATPRPDPPRQGPPEPPSDGRMRNWAADLLRGGLRRGKA
jgi:tetratricopeptide (TPR) repeat protein